jgi:poly-beta-1,6-N-acetyl-D-glucosamine synthase
MPAAPQRILRHARHGASALGWRPHHGNRVRLLFWLCLAALLWAFAGYPAAMLARARLRRRAGRPGPYAGLPRVSVLLAARNAAEEIEARIDNLLAQDYPADRLEVIIACNGSADGTEALARTLAATRPRVTVVRSAAADGKAGALNAATEVARGDVFVFADVRQRFAPRTVRRLLRPFRDRQVGGVTGRLVIGRSDTTVVAGVGSYWELEGMLRLAEGQTGSVVGATGAVYAVRRACFRPLPSAVILDDVWLPLTVVRQGHRIVMAPRALAFDRPSPDYGTEYRRRVRTLVGNLELIRLMPWLLSPLHNPIFTRFVSHKLLRLLTPVFCAVLAVSGLLLPGIGYRAVAATLVAGYALGGIGLVARVRVLALPSAFLLLHTAGIAALMRPAQKASDVWAP